MVATLGERIDTDVLSRVLGIAHALGQVRHPGITEVVSAYASVTVFYDPVVLGESGVPPYQQVCRMLEEAAGATMAVSGSTIEIPVCYGGSRGPDLANVAAHAGISAEEVVALHSGGHYLVHAIGFAPGFPYLGGMPEKIATPRLLTPRSRVGAGSVGIAGAQTGVYPLESPGGWNIIGWTPVKLFEATRDPAALLKPGDRVRFVSVSEKEALSWK